MDIKFCADYFQVIFSPKKIYTQRNRLSLGQIIFIFAFLNGLLMIPSLFYALDNQPYTIIIQLAIYFFMSLLFELVCTAVILCLTWRDLCFRKAFKQGLNLALNAMGVSVIVTFVIGLWKYDMILMSIVQSSIFTLMILASFAKTRFELFDFS